MVLATLAIALVGCSTPADVEDHFWHLAENVGYRCHPTVPPSESAERIVTCRADGPKELSFVVYRDEAARKRGEGQFATHDVTVSRFDGRWILYGSEPSDVDRLADELAR